MSAGVTKICTVCKAPKPLSEFHRDRSRRDGKSNRCKTCNIAHSKKYESGFTREEQRVYELMHYYGLTKEQWNDILAKQNGVCAICKGPPTMRGVFFVDHCHNSLKVRGLLCAHCNTGIGYFKDDPQRLTVAAEYLQNAKEKHRVPV